MGAHQRQKNLPKWVKRRAGFIPYAGLGLSDTESIRLVIGPASRALYVGLSSISVFARLCVPLAWPLEEHGMILIEDALLSWLGF